ncbi:helix-turn-helix domain-containing protein [soil metagenome]
MREDGDRQTRDDPERATAPGDDPFAKTRWLDETSLKALAHPLRVQLMESLHEDGPATASVLARRLGETSGATSYHLRQLERHGFVADDPERGTGRERWWRSAVEGISVRGFDFLRNPATAAEAGLLLREFSRGRQARLERWMAEGHTWPEQWRDASGESEYRATMTPEELAALHREINQVAVRHEAASRAREPLPGQTRVTVQLAAFPIRRPSDDSDAD